MGRTPLHTGFALVPWAVGTAVAALVSGIVLAETSLAAAELQQSPDSFRLDASTTGVLSVRLFGTSLSRVSAQEMHRVSRK
jgi:hypothetical protein